MILEKLKVLRDKYPDVSRDDIFDVIRPHTMPPPSSRPFAILDMMEKDAFVALVIALHMMTEIRNSFICADWHNDIRIVYELAMLSALSFEMLKDSQARLGDMQVNFLARHRLGNTVRSHKSDSVSATEGFPKLIDNLEHVTSALLSMSEGNISINPQQAAAIAHITESILVDFKTLEKAKQQNVFTFFLGRIYVNSPMLLINIENEKDEFPLADSTGGIYRGAYRGTYTKDLDSGKIISAVIFSEDWPSTECSEREQEIPYKQFWIKALTPHEDSFVFSNTDSNPEITEGDAVCGDNFFICHAEFQKMKLIYDKLSRSLVSIIFTT